MRTDDVLARVREAAVARGLHPRTRATYVRWASRYLRFLGARSPARPGAGALRAFLSHVADADGVADATQRQARSALCFLYREGLGLEVAASLPGSVWRLAPPLPVDVVRRVLAQLPAEPWLMAALVYGAGLRVGECCRLRIRDVELARGVIRVRRPDGGQDRLTLIPEAVREALTRQVAASRRRQLRQATRCPESVPLPVIGAADAIVSSHWRWMWVFPSSRAYRHRRSGRSAVQPLHPRTLQRALGVAARAAGVAESVGPVTCQRLRQTFAAQLLASGYPIGAVQRVLGHRDRATTLRYHDALPVGWLGLRSPLDFGMPVPLPVERSVGESG